MNITFILESFYNILMCCIKYLKFFIENYMIGLVSFYVIIFFTIKFDFFTVIGFLTIVSYVSIFIILNKNKVTFDFFPIIIFLLCSVANIYIKPLYCNTVYTEMSYESVNYSGAINTHYSFISNKNCEFNKNIKYPVGYKRNYDGSEEEIKNIKFYSSYFSNKGLLLLKNCNYNSDYIYLKENSNTPGIYVNYSIADYCSALKDSPFVRFFLMIQLFFEFLFYNLINIFLPISLLLAIGKVVYFKVKKQELKEGFGYSTIDIFHLINLLLVIIFYYINSIQNNY